MPPITGLLETSVYAADLARSLRFYEEIMGFKRLWSDERGCALSIAGRQVFLVFRKAGSLNHSPPHDANGRMHAAFSILESELDAWEQWLSFHGVALETRTVWPKGGTSLYFRDPDGHLLELATPGVWEIY